MGGHGSYASWKQLGFRGANLHLFSHTQSLQQLQETKNTKAFLSIQVCVRKSNHAGLTTS